MVNRIELDEVLIKALASNVRIKVLKSLDIRNKTLSELSREMGLSKPTLLNHLRVLTNAGLIDRSDRPGSKWVYYFLTPKAKELLHPSEKTKVVLLLTLSFVSFVGSVVEIYKYLVGKKIEVPIEEIPVPRPVPIPPEITKEKVLIHDPLDLAIGVGLILIAAFILYYLLKGPRRIILIVLWKFLKTH
jgi:DNA-binding transcriptional ArsR family regulator